jgi:hypothetical protein
MRSSISKLLYIKKFESKDTLLWFVILILFYLTNAITRLTHQPSSLRLYSKTTIYEPHSATMLYDVEYVDGHNTSSSCLIQFYSNTPYYMKHIFPSEAPICKTLLYNFTYRHLYIVLGRPHIKPLFTQPYPHNGLF